MLLPSTRWSAEGNGKRDKEGKNYRLKLGWKTFTTPFLKKHSVRIKQAPVCEECSNRFGGTFPSLCPFSDISCFLSSCLHKTSCPFWGLSSPPPFCFVSLSLSLVMSLSRRESLGYQCTATDRKRLINKLSCFSSPLYPSLFFLKRGLPLLPTTFLLIPPPPFPSSSSLLPFSSSLSWMAGSHRCVTIITHTLRKK